MRTRAFGFLLAATLALAPAFAAESENWIRLATPHFELYTTVNEKSARDAILYFEQVRSFFTLASPVRGVTEFPVRIVIFKSEKQFRPYAPNGAAFAYFVGSQSRDYIVMQSADKEHLPAAIHEYMHLVVQHSKLKLPLWLNEGWADVYSSLKPQGQKSAIGDLLPGRVQTLFREKWLTFDQLTSVTEQSPVYNEKDRAGIFYAESWALTHMLYLSHEYKTKFVPFLLALHSGKSIAEACETALGHSPAEVYADLEGYLKKNRLYGALFDVKLTKSEEQAEISSISAGQAELVEADLLAAIGRYEEARSSFERLAKTSPNDPEIRQSLGYLALRGGDREAARLHFEAALAATKDPQLCYNLALLERDARQPKESVLPAFLCAIKYKSDYTEARLQLGLYELSLKDYEAALAALIQIHTAPPDLASPLFNGLAFAWLQTGNLAEARRQAIIARKWNRTDAENQQTDELIRYLDTREARLQPAPPSSTSPSEAPSSEPPPLARPAPAPAATPSQPVQSGSRLARVEGLAKEIQCLPKGARFIVSVKGKPLVFDMPEPERVQLRHNSAVTFDFSCGPQKPFPVAVEYDPATASATLAGDLRVLEF